MCHLAVKVSKYIVNNYDFIAFKLFNDILCIDLLLERFRDVNSSYSGYKSAHVHKSTGVMQSRTSRVINKMATSYGY